MKPEWDENAILELVRESVAHELPPGSPIPEANVDLLKSEMLDSMGWVGVLSALEKAIGVRSFAESWPKGEPQSMTALAQLALQTTVRAETAPAVAAPQLDRKASRQVLVGGWGTSLGSLKLEAAEIESQFGLSAGTISERAGVRSIVRVAGSEDELSLGQAAANRALETGQADSSEVEFLVCTSTTFLELPSFSAALHSRLLLSGSTPAFDVGGACVGLANALAIAKNIMAAGGHRTALVVASEVHSRRLASSAQAGEFRGLFGDGACAFLLRSPREGESDAANFRIGEFVSGCSGSISSALHLCLHSDGTVRVDLDGEALGRGAVATLNDIVAKLERLSGVARSDVEYFAFHEPNPRLAVILAQRANVPVERFTHTTETTGNLGSVTCGVNLCSALTRAQENHQPRHGDTIFVAAVGPGVLWSGTYIQTEDEKESSP